MPDVCPRSSRAVKVCEDGKTIMKIYLILGLLVTAAYAEKKINLDDIERDNLRAESKPKTEKIQTETKYSKPDPYQSQYQINNGYNTISYSGSNLESSIPAQQLQDLKYSLQSPEYFQSNQYSPYEVQYKQPSQILQQQNTPLLQYYNGYQQREELPARNIAPSSFDSQKLNYQPEIPIGNHIQNVQQKIITDKYAKIIHKEPAYTPAPQLLPYYPFLGGINTLFGTKGASLPQPALHQLSSEPAQQISIPVYTPIYNQKQLITPAKPLYQYSFITPTAFTPKVSKASAYSLPVTSKKSQSSPVMMTPLPQPQPQPQPQQQLISQGKKLLYTQAYIRPTQPQYLQQLVYAPQPGVVYSEPNAAYSDLYARIPAYIQDNSLRDQVNQYQAQHQQLYVLPTIAHEAPRQVFQGQISQNIPQSYVKIDIPNTGFVPPQSPSQNFKSGITQLEPLSFEDEEFLPMKDYSSSSGPKSLLDTYIPSKIIAAQDAARYTERPIKLEGGFLPSNMNFMLNKQKSE